MLYLARAHKQLYRSPVWCTLESLHMLRLRSRVSQWCSQGGHVESELHRWKRPSPLQETRRCGWRGCEATCGALKIWCGDMPCTCAVVSSFVSCFSLHPRQNVVANENVFFSQAVFACCCLVWGALMCQPRIALREPQTRATRLSSVLSASQPLQICSTASLVL